MDTPEVRQVEVGTRGQRGQVGGGGRTLIVRALVWILISTGFLLWNLRRIVAVRAAGAAVPWWGYVQVLLWMVALGFWVWMGWRDFSRRDTGRS